MGESKIHVACGGWGGHLDQYAMQFKAVEINTTFYGIPRHENVERWAKTVPENFRFSVKLFQGYTHTHRLREHATLEEFF